MSYPLLSNDINTTESTTKRQGFYIHGGESYGDNGEIDLSKEDTRFFQVLESLKQEYKDILEYIKDNKGRIIIKLEVGYGEELSWIKIARAELRVLEIEGAKHNPRIIEYHSTTGKFKDDETAWCSSFVNWVITQAGIKGTNSTRAASWENWGQRPDKPAYGCIGVIVWGDGTGHVTFIVGKVENGNLAGLSEYSIKNFKAFVYPLGYTPNYELPLMDNKSIGKRDSTR
ncbi:TIGR02594 family protein [Helicobacter trogontum]|uniref:TIGR02594 family protein n=1 Tax=Helicobacter trogontum TaxID=50960 RepID=A0A4V6HY92_9HELI|nr:TIGR02594 family protein [Helicobacter trogontum]TLD79752.1 TIGR02594 family protein [Helicobacter trogontum]